MSMTDAEWFQPARPTFPERKPRRVHAPEYLPWGKRRANATSRKERAALPRKKSGEAKITLREIKSRLVAIKLARGCADCGYRAHACALDFDHVRGKKSALLSQITVSFWSIVEHEMAKCEVVCANCHRVRHHGSRK